MDLYRFRSMEYLLGDKYQELENQDIYFASPDGLNDPMEGLRDIVWSGDKIVWTNFFKHCVYCHYQSYSLLRKVKGFIKLDADSIPILDRWDEPPTPLDSELFNDIWHRFLNLPHIPEIIEALSTTDCGIRYRELGYYLRVIQSVLLGEIVASYIAHGLMWEFERPQPPEELPARVILRSILTSIRLFNDAETDKERNDALRQIESMDNDQRIKQQLNTSNSYGNITEK